MILLVGLGNPGAEYRFTRHNFGFIILDALQEDYGFSPWREKFKGLVSEGTMGNTKVILLKPQTYMNLSGQSVLAVMQFYKIPLDHVIVVHDDLDLPPQKIRFKIGGSSGGHKGLNDIDQRVGQNYGRLRLGIGHPRTNSPSSTHQEEHATRKNISLAGGSSVSNYVLNNFTKEDLTWIGSLLESISHHISLLLEKDSEKFVSKVMQDMGSDLKKEG